MKTQFVKQYGRRIADSINDDIINFKGQFHIASMTTIVTDYDESDVLVLWESNDD